MDKMQNASHKIIYNFIYIALVFILSYLFALGINLDFGLSLQFLIVTVFSLIVKFFLFNPLFLYILLALSFLIGLLINHYLNPFIVPLFERIYILFENIIYNFQGKENIADENIFLYWTLLVVLVSLFNAILLFKNKNIYLLLPLYTGSFLYYWYNFHDQAYWSISIFFLVFFILMASYKFTKKRESFSGKEDVNIDNLYISFLKTGLRYSILIVALALLLPKNYNYITWPWLQERVFYAFPFVEDLRSYKAYTRDVGEASLFVFSMTGQENSSSRLGGPVNLSNKRIMTVYSNEGHYLRGSVQHTYTGNEWQSIRNPTSYHPIRSNFSDWSGNDMRPYYKYEILTIQNHDFASTALFSPYKAAFIDTKHGSEVALSRDDILTFPPGIYNGESYTIWAQEPLPYGMLKASDINLLKGDIDDIDIYLQAPNDKISERTKKLTREIVVGSKSDYEKAIKIENYLRENYKYELSPTVIPDGYEFIDYFLFEGKEGYCTYYATSMAIMLRLEGIPTRYVEGYLAFDSIDDGIYEVRHDNAHSWVEAFIEPVGWMSFEPTPAYPKPDRLEDYEPDIVEESPGENPNHNQNSNEDDFIERPEVTDDSDLGYNGPIISQENSVEDRPSNGSITFLVSAFLMILPIRYLIGFYKYKSTEARARKLSARERVLYLYGEIVHLIDLIGYQQVSGETHHEFAQRVGYKFYDLGDSLKSFIDITDIFVRSKYGNMTSHEDVLILEDYRGRLETRLKNKVGLVKYYYRKYID